MLISHKQHFANAISFGVDIVLDPLPFVGELDLKGNPVHLKDSSDVRAYVRVKQLFAKRKYNDCIEVADEMLARYPKSLFRSDLFYYKIKSLYELGIYDSVIELAKEYLRNYSSSENVPEILMLNAVAFYKNGQFSDADYFFDRLFSEHSESIYAKLGYIHKGDMAFDSGENSKAKKFYTKALVETKSIDVAALAAFKLSVLYASEGKYDRAKSYLEKILKAKDDFFYNHYKEAKQLMYDLADAQRYLEAAWIDRAILKYQPKKHDEYELNLRNLGMWLSQTTHKKEAIEALERYIKEFSDGNYIEEVEKRRDSLFFTPQKSSDYKSLLKSYESLIERYGLEDPIGKKALCKKVKLLLSKGLYSDVLELREDIMRLDSLECDKEVLIHKAAMGLMESALRNKSCQIVLDVQRDYNITVSSKWDFGLYDCFIKAGDFFKAKQIATRNLTTKDLALKMEWLYRYAKVDFETGNYSEAVDAIRDLLALIEDIKKSKYKDIYRTLFDAYDRLGNYEGMIDTIGKIESLFGLDYRDIDRYVAMINVGIAKKDNNIIIRYGKKLYELQKRIKSHIQSPFVEFALYQAYVEKEEYKHALDVIASLDDVKLSKSQRARQKYLKGAVLDKLWRNEEAKKAYKEAYEADPNSAWGKLANSAMQLQ